MKIFLYRIESFIKKILFQIKNRKKRIFFGKNIRIDNINCIEFDKAISISDNVWINCSDLSSVYVGSLVHIGRNCYFSLGGNNKIGKGTLIGSNVKLLSQTHSLVNPNVPMSQTKIIQNEGIIIEDNCWLGESSIVLGGNKVGRNSIIGAYSLVNINIPEYCIAYGNPIRVVKQLNPKKMKCVNYDQNNKFDYSEIIVKFEKYFNGNDNLYPNFLASSNIFGWK